MNAQTAPSGTSAKSDVDAIMSMLARELSGTKLRDAQTFAVEFLRRVPAEDLASRDPAQWAAIVQGAVEFLRERLRALTAIASTLREGASQERDTALSKRSSILI